MLCISWSNGRFSHFLSFWSVTNIFMVWENITTKLVTCKITYTIRTRLKVNLAINHIGRVSTCMCS